MSAWTTGIGYAVAAGMVWSISGVIFSRIARDRADFAGMMLVCTLIMSAAAWWLFPSYAAWGEVDPRVRWQFVGLLGPSGVLVVAGSLSLQQAMRFGHHGTSWAIAQSAMVVPVVAGVLVWGEVMLPGRVAGLACVVVAMALLARSQTRGESKDGWRSVWWALAGFTGWGLQQSLLASQSYLTQLAPLYSWRIPVAATGSCITWAMWMTWRRRWPGSAAWRVGCVCAAVLLSGYWLMFRGLDALREAGAASLFFPMAVGISIMMFAVYSSSRERWTVSAVIGLVLGVTGLLCLGLAQ